MAEDMSEIHAVATTDAPTLQPILVKRVAYLSQCAYVVMLLRVRIVVGAQSLLIGSEQTVVQIVGRIAGESEMQSHETVVLHHNPAIAILKR